MKEENINSIIKWPPNGKLDYLVEKIRFSPLGGFLCALLKDKNIKSSPKSLLIWPKIGIKEPVVFPILDSRIIGNSKFRTPTIHDAIPIPGKRTIAIQVGTEILFFDYIDECINDRIDVGVEGCWEMGVDKKGQILAVAYSLSYPPLVICDIQNNKIHKLEPPSEYEYSAHMPRLSVALEGEFVALAFDFDSVFFWESHSGKFLAQKSFSEISANIESELDQEAKNWRSWRNQFCRCLKLKSDGTQVALASFPYDANEYSNMGAWSIGLQRDSQLSICPVYSNMSAADFSPDLSLLACTMHNSPDKIGIWEMKFKTLLAEINHGLALVGDIKWSPDGNILAIGGKGGLTVFRFKSKIWSEFPECAVWELKVGSSKYTRVVGDTKAKALFDKEQIGKNMPFDELVAILKDLY